MNFVAHFGPRVLLRRPLCGFRFVSRVICSYSSCSGSDNDDRSSCDDGFDHIDQLIREHWKVPGFDRRTEGDDDDDDDDKMRNNGYIKLDDDCDGIMEVGDDYDDIKRNRNEGDHDHDDKKRNRVDCDSDDDFDTTWGDADRLFDVLRQDGVGFNLKSGLDESGVRVSLRIVRQVFLKILRVIAYENRSVYARMAYKFFIWCSDQEYYTHTVNTYHLLLKVFAAADEFKAMWRLVDDMTEKGYPTTARTLNILLSSCHGAGLQRTIVEKFVRSKTFNYRPFKHSYSAILLCLLNVNQHKLVEWVYEQMLSDGFSPDVLTYNIIISAQYRLGKMDHVHRLLDEMGKAGLSPDLHTYNILLHILGKGQRPLAALHLLNHMREVGVYPSVLHFATLIDGLGRSGDMDACKYFFDEMIKNEIRPDVVCYTVLINGYIAAGELGKAQQLFEDMVVDGQLPNVFTYNSMIRGFCIAEKFEEARAMLKEMEKKGCTPNFLVYNNLVGNLQRAGKLSEANEIMEEMTEKGRYVHHISRLKRYQKS